MFPTHTVPMTSDTEWRCDEHTFIEENGFYFEEINMENRQIIKGNCQRGFLFILLFLFLKSYLLIVR